MLVLILALHYFASNVDFLSRYLMKFIIIRVGDDLIFFEREHVSDIMVLKGETKEQLLKSRIRDEEEKETEIQEEYSVAIGISGRQSYKVFSGTLSDCISFIIGDKALHGPHQPAVYLFIVIILFLFFWVYKYIILVDKIKTCCEEGTYLLFPLLRNHLPFYFYLLIQVCRHHLMVGRIYLYTL